MYDYSNEEVIQQLDKVLASPNFVHSAVLTNFLRHIVLESLEGRSYELKEYTIAVAALNKDTNFNPQIDSIVRIHAGRLRRALRDYYQTDGMNDPIVIIVPKGSYVPVFKVNTTGRPVSEDVLSPVESESSRHETSGNNRTPEKNRLERKPSIMVMPFRVISGESKSHHSLTEFLSTELTKFTDLAVLSSHATIAPGTQQPDYLLSGSIQQVDNKVRIFVQFYSPGDGKQHWANTFERKNGQEQWQFEDEVVTRTLAAIGGINGVISRLEAHQSLISSPTETLSLSYWYKQHIINFDTEITATARRYYEHVVAAEPDNALAISYLSEIICCQKYTVDETERPAQFERALGLARRALLNDPTCQQAYLALASVMLDMGRRDDCIRALERGLAINPRGTDFVSAAGAFLIMLGQYERGYSLMEKGLHLNPDPPWSHFCSLALHAFHKKSYHETIRWLDQMKVGNTWESLLRTATYVYLGEMDKARNILAEFRQQYPVIDPMNGEMVEKLFFLSEIAADVNEALTKINTVPLFE